VLVLGSTALALALGQALAPMASAATTITWRPEAPPANTGFWSNACTTPSTSAPAATHTALADDDLSAAKALDFVAGESASDVAWQLAPSSGEAGPVVSLPATVTGFSVRARATGTGSSGRLLIYYRPGSSTTDYYVGEAAVTASGDWATLDKSDGLIWWRHRKPGLLTPEWSPVYTAGLLPPEPAAKPLSQFVQDKVTGGSLLASYQLGCGGGFDIDHLTVTTGSGQADYDLTNQASTSTLTASSTRVGAGGTVRLTGHVVGGFTGATPAGGTTELQSAPFGSSTWTTVGPGTSFTVKPNGTTSYRLRYSGSPAAGASTSAAVTVQVVTGVVANLQSTSVSRGGTVRLTGRIAPANSGVPVSLQRKVGSTWKTLATTRTTSGGVYSVGAKATSEGPWTVRATAGSVRGNLAGVSAARSLTVRTATHVSLSLSSASVLTGHKFKLHGKANPHKKGVKVTLQRRTSKGWVKAGTTRTSKRGTFSFTRKAGSPGNAVYRVVVAGWGFKATGVSPARTLVVRSPAPPPPPPSTGGGGGTGIGGGGGTGIG
jgi:hypothetical protein